MAHADDGARCADAALTWHGATPRSVAGLGGRARWPGSVAGLVTAADESCRVHLSTTAAVLRCAGGQRLNATLRTSGPNKYCRTTLYDSIYRARDGKRELYRIKLKSK